MINMFFVLFPLVYALQRLPRAVPKAKSPLN
jgi:hypothetical protein